MAKKVTLGAKSQYWSHVKPRFKEIEAWLKGGLDEKDIFANLGIGKTSWENYKNNSPELRELIKKGRETPIKVVANSLYKNATGFYYYIDKEVKVKNSDGSERIEIIELKKFKPPETTACIFYLKNKDKKNWGDNPQMIDLRREELEWRKEQAAFNDW